MEIIKSQIKKWGNSYGMIIPKHVIDSENLKENQKIEVLLLKDSKKVFNETFGSLKGKLKKSTQDMKDELRKELYND